MKTLTRAQEVIIFQYVLGRTLNQWASVEDELRAVMVSCFPDDDRNRVALAIGLFSLEGFRAKLRFVDGVVCHKLGDSLLVKDWRAIFQSAATLSQQRNALAHRAMGKFADCEPGRRVVLVPWVFPAPKRKTKGLNPPDGSLRINDIVKLDRQFFALQVSLLNFRHRMIGQPEPHPKSDEQAANPQTLASITRLIREVFGPQP